ncbi:MAG: sugar MFS transporter [Bacteroidetes bacterium]|nr:sugar MFS transporter [Bacteroidota bacterium]MBS1739087.1 sugar MFS transporter [Bacteroidota bacterium]MBS1777224.1 sugar MFS transporter [Bacteroidota bacterium]
MTQNNKNYTSAIFFIGILFFIFGFITWANSQLIPYLKIACELTDTQSYLVATAFFAAYFFMAIPSSLVLKKTGFKNGMSVGLIIMALGALLFVPAAKTRNYSLFLAGLFIIGTGLALLQTASNPYVAALGPIDSAAKRISIMGICNKIAGILSVYILGNITLKNVDELKIKLTTLGVEEKTIELNMLASKVIVPYLIIAAVLILLAVIFYFMNLPEIQEENVTSKGSPKTSVMQYPHLLLGALAIFFYVGVEVISYDTFASFGEYLGFPLQQSKSFASYTGYGLLAGYILSIIAIPKFISQRTALIVANVLSIFLVVLATTTNGYLAVICFALLGFSNSVMWPAIWPLALEGLGKFTKIGSALLIMGIVGGALLPPFYGKIGELVHSKQSAYLILIPCYLYILYFAVSGHKAGLQEKPTNSPPFDV